MMNTVTTVISDKENLIKELLRQLQESDKAMRGLDHAAPTVLTNESDANTRKMLNVTMTQLKR